MGWKCTPQIKGLIRGDFKKTEKRKGKRRANGKAFFLEAGEERVSQSETLDRSRSYLNTYEGYTKGLDAWLDLKEEADDYEAPVVTKKKVKNEETGEMEEQEVTHYRKLRDDAVVGFAVIINPPHDAAHGEDGDWDQETYQKFYKDSWDVLHELYPELFRDDNVILKATHRDEGYPVEDGYDSKDIDEHQHILGRCRDENGKWIGKEIDYAMFDNINKNYPRMMRERGWSEMEDLDVTDRKRMKEDPEYKAERKAKAKHGKSVNQHIREKMKNNLKQSEVLLDQSQQLAKENEEKSEEIEITRSKQKEDQKKLDDGIAENNQKKIEYSNAITDMNNLIQDNKMQQIALQEKLKKEKEEEVEEYEEQFRKDMEQQNASKIEQAQKDAKDEIIRNSAQVIEDEKKRAAEEARKEVLEDQKSVIEEEKKRLNGIYKKNYEKQLEETKQKWKSSKEKYDNAAEKYNEALTKRNEEKEKYETARKSYEDLQFDWSKVMKDEAVDIIKTTVIGQKQVKDPATTRFKTVDVTIADKLNEMLRIRKQRYALKHGGESLLDEKQDPNKGKNPQYGE